MVKTVRIGSADAQATIAPKATAANNPLRTLIVIAPCSPAPSAEVYDSGKSYLVRPPAGNPGIWVLLDDGSAGKIAIHRHQPQAFALAGRQQ
ncbi:MAG TPA: hypothetical protein PLJ22_04405, partial [Kiritimatiellia bacterium]|nr:hypothetical protein [Kiritimatiellia bacterium]